MCDQDINLAIRSICGAAKDVLNLRLFETEEGHPDYRINFVATLADLPPAVDTLNRIIFPQDRLPEAGRLGGAWSVFCPGEIFLVLDQRNGETGEQREFTGLLALIHELAHLFVIAGIPINGATGTIRDNLLYTRDDPPPWTGINHIDWEHDHAPKYLPRKYDNSIDYKYVETITHFITQLLVYELAESDLFKGRRVNLISCLGDYNKSINAPEYMVTEDYLEGKAGIALEPLFSNWEIRRSIGKWIADFLLQSYPAIGEDQYINVSPCEWPFYIDYILGLEQHIRKIAVSSKTAIENGAVDRCSIPGPTENIRF